MYIEMMGALTIRTMVVGENHKYKMVTLATIHCEYNEAADLARGWRKDNSHIRSFECEWRSDCRQITL